MAFKSLNTFNEEKDANFFLLKNDGDSADVIFLYQSSNDALVADVHYIKSAESKGYAHCLGAGCPACSKGIRVQTKLFIPLYNLTANKIEFWDRTPRFDPQLQHDVFNRYPNPSEYVFRITRKGAAGDVNTTYEIVPVAKNNVSSYAQILADNHTQMPDAYEMVCKSMNNIEMSSILSSNDNNYSSSGNVPDYSSYGAVPRNNTPAVSMPMPEAPMPNLDDVPDMVIDGNEYEAPEIDGDALAEPEF